MDNTERLNDYVPEVVVLREQVKELKRLLAASMHEAKELRAEVNQRQNVIDAFKAWQKKVSAWKQEVLNHMPKYWLTKAIDSIMDEGFTAEELEILGKYANKRISYDRELLSFINKYQHLIECEDFVTLRKRIAERIDNVKPTLE